MNFPEELKYTATDEWVKMIDETTALVGLSDFAQDALGDLVYINLPVEGDAVEAGSTLCDVESVKAVSDIYSPVTGTVAEINEELLDAPEMINDAPYDAWFIKVENVTEHEDLMTEEEYNAFCEAEA